MKQKGLRMHAFVVMTSHFHAIISGKKSADLPGIIRDLKKYTARKLVEMVKEGPESKKELLLHIFSKAAQRQKRGRDFMVWQSGYHAKQLESNSFMQEKLDYIHMNQLALMFLPQFKSLLSILEAGLGHS